MYVRTAPRLMRRPSVSRTARLLGVLSVSVLLLLAQAQAASESDDEQAAVADLCHAAGSSEIPRKDRPSPQEIQKYRAYKHACVDFREGVGVPQDYVAYRKCLLSRDGDDYSLAQVYANGWGVPSSPKLAMALVCRAGAPVAELHGMLQALNTGSTLDARCAYGGSRVSMIQCAAESNYIEKRSNEVKLVDIKAKWSIGDRTSFSKVEQALKAFSEVRAQNEVDTTGTIGMAYSTYTEVDRTHLIAGIELFEDKKYPSVDGDPSSADRELNRLYQTIMQMLKRDSAGTITVAGVRNTQRLWLTYRDAFIQFARTRYGGENQEQWLAWLTQIRVRQLNDLLQEMQDR